MKKDKKFYLDTMRKSGVRSLKEYGYPDVNETNLTTDYIYANFFMVQLEDTQLSDMTRHNKPLEEARLELLAECKTAKLPEAKTKKAAKPKVKK